MARERTGMRKPREILHHVLDLGLSYQVTEQSLKISQQVLQAWCRRCASAGSWVNEAAMGSRHGGPG